jgi:hypothetical protein
MRTALKIGAVNFPIIFGTDWDIPADAIVVARLFRPDGETFDIPAERTAIRTVTATTDEEMYSDDKFAMSGMYRGELIFTYDDRVTPSQTFLLKVEGLAGT